MIFQYTTKDPYATVILYGGKKDDPAPFAAQYSISRKQPIDFTVLPPSNQLGKGYQVITRPRKPGIIYSDGVLIAKGQTATIRSKDCAIVFIKNLVTGFGALVHAGRPAMTPNKEGQNIISLALDAVRPNGCDTVAVYIRGSICGRCFVHETPEARELIAPFANKYLRAIHRADGGLDIPTIIVTQLQQAGVKPQQIDFDSLCTYEHEGLSSHRRRDPMSNMVLVLNH